MILRYIERFACDPHVLDRLDGILEAKLKDGVSIPSDAQSASLKLQIDAADRSRHETIDLAIKAFELSQNLRAKWLAADVSAKRRILEIICLNWTLDGEILVPQMKKPFDQMAQGLQKKDSRGDRI